jgi:hypothetical protein
MSIPQTENKIWELLESFDLNTEPFVPYYLDPNILEQCFLFKRNRQYWLGTYNQQHDTVYFIRFVYMAQFVYQMNYHLFIKDMTGANFHIFHDTEFMNCFNIIKGYLHGKITRLCRLHLLYDYLSTVPIPINNQLIEAPYLKAAAAAAACYRFIILSVYIKLGPCPTQSIILFSTPREANHKLPLPPI